MLLLPFFWHFNRAPFFLLLLLEQETTISSFYEFFFSLFVNFRLKSPYNFTSLVACVCVCVCVCAFFSIHSPFFQHALRPLKRRTQHAITSGSRNNIKYFAGKFGLCSCCFCCILMTMNNFMSSIISILLKIMSPRKLMCYANSTCEKMVVTGLPPSVIIPGKSRNRVFFLLFHQFFCASLSTF